MTASNSALNRSHTAKEDLSVVHSLTAHFQPSSFTRNESLPGYLESRNAFTSSGI